ncbi:hypothetical protein [Rhodoferax sp. UBA5149]|uniref:hypothetical protein n=1 Tax=Rhodoferax sp. UBA5149 TaxID=1947379 RepID=UPI0025D401CA|nr:hypothetical protein [Rhodoferax sp. UBA5149]
MLSTHAWRASAVAVITLWLAACGGGTELLIIPLFEFGFSGTSGAVQASVFFLPDTPTQSSGSFDQVNVSVNGGAQTIYAGTYSGCNFKLSTVVAVAPPLSVGYSGRFTGNDSIELTPTNDVNLPVLTLQRQGTGSRNMGC